jgi:hypothetical protein
MHKSVQSTSIASRANIRDAHNKAVRVQVANFDVGDFVRVAKREFEAGDKLTLKWRGPRRVVKVLSEQVSTVEDLRDGSLADVHNTRLRFYSDCMLHTVDQLLEHIVHNEQGYPVSGFRELSFDKESKQFLVRVAWHGFEPDDDTMEPCKICMRTSRLS